MTDCTKVTGYKGKKMQIILQVSFKEIETKGNKGKEIDFWYLRKKMKQRGESKRNEHG